MTELQHRIGLALGNQNLRTALARGAGRWNLVRHQALAALPDPEAARDRARQIRLETLKHLDRYLEQLEASVQRAGGQVHWAQDAREACNIIRDLALARGVKLVAKGKSMVSEEIDLNPALEAAGLKVVETDLGEYIVQMAGQRPSHITAPALHLRKEDVSALFQKHLGMEPTDDPRAMTVLARAKLREVFLAAGMGITGVNFAVAETGTLALVTNEGNGRMVTTLPPIHVALMGLERVVPTLMDLEVVLRVLARSSTGQKLSAYTTLLTGPRRPGDPDGPGELHLVILDNGRARVLGGDLAETLLCIRCGACQNVCPVYHEIGGHAYGSIIAGPIGAVLTPAMHGTREWGELAELSSLCGACQAACPVRIDIPTMLLKVRDAHTRATGGPAWLRLGMKAWQAGMTSLGRYRWGQRLARWGARLLAREGRIRRLPGPLSYWTNSRDFPAFAQSSFRERWKKRSGK
jgi:L-lactate dehydrogenase complex protein LldF